MNLDDFLAPDECELCERTMPLTRHHLYPRDQHRRLVKQKKMSKSKLLSEIAEICRPCHSAVHRLFTNRQLADRFNSIEALVQEDVILKWVDFIRKQRTYTKKDARIKGIRYKR